jgi:hypothetical protein
VRQKLLVVSVVVGGASVAQHQLIRAWFKENNQ